MYEKIMKTQTNSESDMAAVMHAPDAGDWDAVRRADAAKQAAGQDVARREAVRRAQWYEGLPDPDAQMPGEKPEPEVNRPNLSGVAAGMGLMVVVAAIIAGTFMGIIALAPWVMPLLR